MKIIHEGDRRPSVSAAQKPSESAIVLWFKFRGQEISCRPRYRADDGCLSLLKKPHTAALPVPIQVIAYLPPTAH